MKTSVTAYEDTIVNCFLDEYDEKQIFFDIPMANHIYEAPLVDDVMMNLPVNNIDLYTALIREEAQVNTILFTEISSLDPEYTTSTKMSNILHDADKCIAKKMYFDGFSHKGICNVLVYSPNFRGLDDNDRWCMANVVCNEAINPLLFTPLVAGAPSLQDVHLDDNQLDSVYGAFLRFTLRRNPEFHLREADAYICKVLSDTHVAQPTIELIMSMSKQFSPVDERFREVPEQYAKFTLERAQRIKKFIAEAQENFVRDIPESLENSFAVYKSMQEKLRSFGREKESPDLVEYWHSVIQVIKESMVRVNEAKTACKILAIWATGMDRASKSFCLDLNPDVVRINREATTLMREFNNTVKNWEFIFDSIKSLEDFSTTLLVECKQRTDLSKIGDIPEVKHAKDFEELLCESAAHKPKEMYFSALQAVAIACPGLGQAEADQIVAEKLKGHCAESFVKKCMMESPLLQHLNTAQKRDFVQQSTKKNVKEEICNGKQ